MIKKNSLVKAADRENYGVVQSVDAKAGTARVKFTSEEGNIAEVDLLLSQLEEVGSKDRLKVNNKEKDIYRGKPTFSSIVDEFRKIGDVFVPAFAGFVNGGQNGNATSTMTIGIEEWVKDNSDVTKNQSGNGYWFEPKITSKMNFVNKTSGKIETIHFPAGVIPIFGGTGSGKTTLMNFINEELNGTYLRFGEPEIPSVHDPLEAMRVIHEFLNDPDSTVLAIDSFRPFFYMVTEKASIGKGGVNNALYMDFTALSSIATWAGKTIFIVINPLASGKDDVENVRTNLESSTIGLIHTQSYGMFSYVARTTENNRKPVTYQTDYKVEKLSHSDDESQMSLDMNLDDKLSYQKSAWHKIMSGLKS